MAAMTSQDSYNLCCSLSELTTTLQGFQVTLQHATAVMEQLNQHLQTLESLDEEAPVKNVSIIYPDDFSGHVASVP